MADVFREPEIRVLRCTRVGGPASDGPYPAPGFVAEVETVTGHLRVLEFRTGGFKTEAESVASARRKIQQARAAGGWSRVDGHGC